MRIHDNTEKTKIEEWERTVEGQYLKSKEEISTQFSDIEQQFEKYFILKKQRAMKYLEYYDIMSNEYDF